MAQLNYNFSTPKGVAGAPSDLNMNEVVTRINEELNGAMHFGFAVVRGDNDGGVKLPVANSIATDFAGIVTNGANVEHDLSGNVSIRKGTALGISKHGYFWGVIAPKSVIAADKAVYMVCDGNNKGKLCTVESNTDVVGVYTITINDGSVDGDKIKIAGTELTCATPGTGDGEVATSGTAATLANSIKVALSAIESGDAAKYTWSVSGAVITGTEKSGNEGAGAPELVVTNAPSGTLKATLDTTTEGYGAPTTVLLSGVTFTGTEDSGNNLAVVRLV